MFECRLQIGNPPAQMRNDLHRHRPVKSQVLGKEDPSHCPTTQRAMEEIAVCNRQANLELSLQFHVA